MNDFPERVLLNHPFVITNGTKTGLFIVYDKDLIINFEINAVKMNSTIGRFFLNLEHLSKVFLLETSCDISEGFWIDKFFNQIGSHQSRSNSTVYGDLKTPVGRFYGYPEKWIFKHHPDESLISLSKMQPNFGSHGEYFRFITSWPEAEKGYRIRIRELRENLTISLDSLRGTAKFFPINGEISADRIQKRHELLDSSEWIAFALRKNDLKFLRSKLSELEKLIREYENIYESDKYSQFALRRFNLVTNFMVEYPDFLDQLRIYDLAR